MATANPLGVPQPEAPRRDKRMSLGAHLVELRRRLLISVLGLIAGMVIAFIVTDAIIQVLTDPIRLVAESRGDADQVALMFTTVTSGFELRIRISVVVGLILSAPVWLSQIWLFVMPGLTRKETRYTWGFLGAAIPLFFAGHLRRLADRAAHRRADGDLRAATAEACSTTPPTTTTSCSSCCSWSASRSCCPCSSCCSTSPG